MIFLIILATIASTFLGGMLAIRFKDKLHLILGFSAGAVIGVALFDLLPESMAIVTQTYDVKLATLFIAIGFIIYMMLDRFLSLHLHNKCENPNHGGGKLGAATLSLHSFLDGLGIGLAFQVSSALGWIVTAAVLTHDFSDGINTVNMILKNHGSRRQAIKWLITDALAPAAGVAVTLFFTVSEPILGLILAIFTGLFLYLGASDLIPESHHRHPTFWTTLMTILGIAVLYGAIHFVG